MRSSSVKAMSCASGWLGDGSGCSTMPRGSARCRLMAGAGCSSASFIGGGTSSVSWRAASVAPAHQRRCRLSRYRCERGRLLKRIARLFQFIARQRGGGAGGRWHCRLIGDRFGRRQIRRGGNRRSRERGRILGSGRLGPVVGNRRRGFFVGDRDPHEIARGRGVLHVPGHFHKAGGGRRRGRSAGRRRRRRCAGLHRLGWRRRRLRFRHSRGDFHRNRLRLSHDRLRLRRNHAQAGGRHLGRHGLGLLARRLRVLDGERRASGGHHRLQARDRGQQQFGLGGALAAGKFGQESASTLARRQCCQQRRVIALVHAIVRRLGAEAGASFAMGNPMASVYQSCRLIRLGRDMPPFPPLRFGFATRLALLYVALFALMGVQLPFFPLWLKAKGLDAGMIGLVLAVPMVVRVLAIPFVARQADRRDAVRAALMVTAAASVAGYLLVAFAEGAGGDPRRLCAGFARLHADRAADRNLCAQGARPARAHLRAGAAVGLGRLHLRLLRHRLCRRRDGAALSDLADRDGRRGHGAGDRAAGAADHAQAGGGCADRAAPAIAARSRLPRRAGGGQPDPGEPRRLLRLLGAGLAARRGSTAASSPRCGRSA